MTFADIDAMWIEASWAPGVTNIPAFFAALIRQRTIEECEAACERLLDDGEDSYVVNKCTAAIRAIPPRASA